MGSVGTGRGYLGSGQISSILSQGETKVGKGLVSIEGKIPDRVLIDDDRLIGSGLSKGVASLHFYVTKNIDGKDVRLYATQEDRQSILRRINSTNQLRQFNNKLDREYNKNYADALKRGLSESEAREVAHKSNQEWQQAYIQKIVDREAKRIYNRTGRELYARVTYRRVLDEHNH